MKNSLKDILLFAEAISRLLHPFAEVVLHNLAKDQIEAIYNPLSQRKMGDASYLERMDFDTTENIIGPYEKTNWDGKPMKSISILLRNKFGKAEGCLCINIDISSFENASQLLKIFLNNKPFLTKNSEYLFKDDLYEKINQYIQEYCQKNHTSIQTLTRQNKKDIIHALANEGAFDGKNTANYIKRILNISRATVYNYLQQSSSETCFD